MFQFENFRVRKLKAINALNFYITLCMAFLAMISMESETNALKVSIIKAANPVKEKVFFCYYRLAKKNLRHTLVCKRRHQAMVSDKTSGIPPTLP